MFLCVFRVQIITDIICICGKVGTKCEYDRNIYVDADVNMSTFRCGCKFVLLSIINKVALWFPVYFRIYMQFEQNDSKIIC